MLLRIACWLWRITDSGVCVRSCTLSVFVCNFTLSCAFSRSNTPKLRPRYSISSKSPKYWLQSSPQGLRKRSALSLILSIIVKSSWNRLSLHCRLLTELHSGPSQHLGSNRLLFTNSMSMRNLDGYIIAIAKIEFNWTRCPLNQALTICSHNLNARVT